MWSWLIIALISVTCLFCFITVVNIELGRPAAKMWLVFTCCSIAGVVGAMISVSSPNMKDYSYEMKPPKIEIKELKPSDEKIEHPATVSPGDAGEQQDKNEQTESNMNDANQTAEGDGQKETVSGDNDATGNQDSSKGKAIVIISSLNIRAEPDINAQIAGNVQNGEVLTILALPDDLDWVQIKTASGVTGWVAKNYVQLLPK